VNELLLNVAKVVQDLLLEVIHFRQEVLLQMNQLIHDPFPHLFNFIDVLQNCVLDPLSRNCFDQILLETDYLVL
jgi:hypothetical protein